MLRSFVLFFSEPCIKVETISDRVYRVTATETVNSGSIPDRVKPQTL